MFFRRHCRQNCAMPKSMGTRSCYAKSLGGCTDLSLEHVITKSIFGDALTVEAYGQSTPQGKRVGLNRLGARVLCSKHNSDLSILDDEIALLANACATFSASPSESIIQIRGPLIERWCLKVIVGSAAAGWVHGQRFEPSDETVRQLFGHEALPSRFALHGLNGVSRIQEWNRSVSWRWFKNRASDEIDMILLVVNELPLVFYTGDGDIEEAVRSAEIEDYDLHSAKVIRRPRTMMLRQMKGGETLTIHISW
jgi:hypothetical protein